MSAFGDQLKAARLKAGLTRGQLAARIGSGSGYVEKIENNRQALSSEQQRRLLEACRNPTRSVQTLVDDFQQDMAVRLATLTNDIETLMAGLDVTRAAAAKAVAVAHPPKRRASK
jgi:transcriptional regulator with XRE-family HTH domain